MGFWKKLGKVALKVAPYAAMAIPGVGVPLGMAIAGGLSAAEKKASGGTWKDSLISGGIGAGTSAIGGKVPGLDKVAGKIGGEATSSFVKDDINKVAGKIASKGVGPSTGAILKKFGTDTAVNTLQGMKSGDLGPIQAALPTPSMPAPPPQVASQPMGIGPSNPNIAATMEQAKMDALARRKRLVAV